MENEEKNTIEPEANVQLKEENAPQKNANATHVVTAESVQAEEVPTIPIGSLDTISTLQPEVSVHAVASMKAVSMPTPLVVQPAEYRRSINEWLQVWRDGIRTPYLVLPIMPLVLGSVLAWVFSIAPQNPLGSFDLSRFVGALIAVFLVQIGANLINDYYDYQRGVDTSNVFGPGGLIQQGLVKPTRVLSCGLGALGIGAIIGLVVSFAGGPFVSLFGLIVILCAYFYSASKQPLSSLGLSELIGLVVFGPLTTLGAYMIQTGGRITSPVVLLYSLPIGLLAAALILANNMRDIEGDQHVNKRTIPTMIGLKISHSIYIAAVVAAYLIIVALGIPSRGPHWVLLAFWSLPTAVIAITSVARASVTANYQQIVIATLKVLFSFAILLVIGLIISYIVPVAPLIPEKILPF